MGDTRSGLGSSVSGMGAGSVEHQEEMSVDEFNRAQTVKWCHLPHAYRRDLVDELGKREGVFVRNMRKGEAFQYVATERVKLLVVKEG